MTKPKTVIRKYGDRRLYDSSASRYVKLDDIARMVRDGIEVEVVDARTGRDLTRVILTQIVMEDTRDRDGGLPMQFLRQLVVASDRATHEFLSWYLNGTLDLYKKAQDAFHSRLAGARSAVTSPLDFVRNLLGAPSGGDPAEIEALHRRVEELEARLAELTPAPRKRKSRRA